MDARPKTRPVHRERNTPTTQPPRGAKQIVIPMTRPQYDEIWHDTERLRGFVAEWAGSAPELFPAGFDQGYRPHGFGRESRNKELSQNYFVKFRGFCILVLWPTTT